MNAERWRRIEEICDSATRREPGERSAFLAEACRGDEELRREVESLLAQPEASRRMNSATWEIGTVPLGEIPAGPLAAGTRLGPYRIESVLGTGGMGEVYRAVDTRLDRKVAIKISHAQFGARFEREARTISSLNHPNICTVYDVGPNYLVTELVEGETLRDWIKRAPAPERCLEVARQMLEALGAAHRAGIVHRDLKPANVMVRFDGYVKVLDFGLAKRMPVAGMHSGDNTVSSELSQPGQMLGTIPYMSPEQILGHEIDPRSDLFAFGIMLYEMIAGRHPWPRNSSVDTLHAILHDDPPTMQTALSGVVDRLLRKNREERYSSAGLVLEALTSPVLLTSPTLRPLTRLIVLPFRILRHHEASDFLAISLPDAITSSLAAIDSLVVRSTMTASRFASSELDVKTIAEQVQVDAILTGTILSDGENLRVNTQLIEAPDGTLLWSDTSKVSVRDIFQLQDDLVDRVVQALKVPLTAREHRALKHDVPANTLAYEFYLRGNQLIAAGYSPQNMVLARDFYLRAVEADPKYAPAWACLGRAHRFLGKYGVEDQAANLARAEEAFRKAFALNPDLALAHNFYTALQTDMGRSMDAMERLLKRAHTHHNDLNLLIGLVQACRYCDLLEASAAAHHLARKLDPQARTSVAYTYLRLGDYSQALEHSGPTDAYVAVPSLMALGREQEAIDSVAGLPYEALCRALVADDRTNGLAALDRLLEVTSFHTSDPEARFCVATYLAKLNDPGRALEFLSQTLDEGYRCHYALMHDPWLDSLRSHSQFAELVNRAEAMSLQARKVFLDNGGGRLLGTQ